MFSQAFFNLLLKASTEQNKTNMSGRRDLIRLDVFTVRHN